MPEVYKISIALTGSQVALLKSAIDSGGYATVSEAIREALREWRAKHGSPKKTKHAKTASRAKKPRRRRVARKRKKKKL